MTQNRAVIVGAFVSLVLAAAIGACHDIDRPLAPRTGAASTLARHGMAIPFSIHCEAHRARRTVACAQRVVLNPMANAIQAKRYPSGKTAALRPADQAIGGAQGTYVTFVAGSYAFDTITNIFSFGATLQNNLREPLGTPDGTTVTGVKIFLLDLYASSGSGSVSVANADGTGNFTAPNQPYFLYNQIVSPQQVSMSRTWEIAVAPTVNDFSFDVESYAGFPAESSVPASAPDSVPASVYADSNMTRNAALSTYEFLDNSVVVLFQSSASQADRALAVAKAGATVVGGLPWGTDGYYFLQVADDAAGDSVFGRVQTLDSLSQVGAAIPNMAFDSTSSDYLRPTDGPAASVWNANSNDPASYSDSNWAQERVALPLAWGCSIGSATTRVAIIDAAGSFAGYSDLDDLAPNVASSPSPPYNIIPFRTQHGTAVASIVGAVGNNGIGSTGVMWKASMALYKRPSPANKQWWTQDLGSIAHAVESNALVINLSGSIGMSPDTNSVEAQVDLFLFQVFLDFTVKILVRGLNYDPLFVFSAGNDARSAAWNGYPILLDSFPERVLVVEATQRSANDQRSSYSNFGSLVNIAAPGGDSVLGVRSGVLALDSAGGTRAFPGTSAAAPLVTGTAGLLFAFDSLLTATNVKTLLINGAVNGGRRSSDGTPVLNAYQSLRLAARAPGARICGNNMYSLPDGSFWVVRNDSNPSADEMLASTTSGILAYPTPAHLGNYITFPLQSILAVTFTNGVWTPQTSFVPPDTLWMPFYNLSNGYDHDGNNQVTATATDTSTAVVSVDSEVIATLPVSGYYGPVDLLEAYATMGDTVYVSYASYDNPDYTAFTSYVWKIPVAGPVPTAPFATLPDTEVWNFGMREDGTGFWVSSSYGFDDPPNCTVDYRDVQWHILRAVASAPAGCYERTNASAAGRIKRKFSAPKSNRPPAPATPQSSRTPIAQLKRQ
jgi:hypothetical protein